MILHLIDLIRNFLDSMDPITSFNTRRSNKKKKKLQDRKGINR